MHRASSATGWARNPIMRLPDLDPHLASSYELGWISNPITGCLNGCPYCYARKLANGRLRERYLANHNFVLAHQLARAGLPWMQYMGRRGDDPFYPRFWAERIFDSRSQYIHLGDKPQGIFVCDMGELFGDWIPREWQEHIFNLIKLNPNHRFYLLTKQPQNLVKFSPFPDNCWVGVTATNREMYATALKYLTQIRATIKYISFEPLLDPIKMGDNWKYEGYDKPLNDSLILQMSGIGWLIIGAQTKPYKPPKIEWVDEITEAANKAGIPVFWKDNLHPLIDDYYRGNYRQEMPAR